LVQQILVVAVLADMVLLVAVVLGALA